MNIVLYKPNKTLGAVGLVLLCLSIVPIFIAVATTYVNWVWGTVALFLIATAVFFWQRIGNEQGDLRAARANAQAINERYGLSLDVGDSYKLTKEFPVDDSDARSKNTYVAHGIGLYLDRKGGEYTMRRSSDREEYVKGQAKPESLVSQADAPEHDDYVKSLYTNRESIVVETSAGEQKPKPVPRKRLLNPVSDEEAVAADSSTWEAAESAAESSERHPRRRLPEVKPESVLRGEDAAEYGQRFLMDATGTDNVEDATRVALGEEKRA